MFAHAGLAVAFDLWAAKAAIAHTTTTSEPYQAAWNVNLGHLYHRARRFADARVCFERVSGSVVASATLWLSRAAED